MDIFLFQASGRDEFLSGEISQKTNFWWPTNLGVAKDSIAYIFVSAPLFAIKYKLIVLKSLPVATDGFGIYDGRNIHLNKNVSQKRLLRLQILDTYGDDEVTLAKLLVRSPNFDVSTERVIKLEEYRKLFSLLNHEDRFDSSDFYASINQIKNDSHSVEPSDNQFFSLKGHEKELLLAIKNYLDSRGCQSMKVQELDRLVKASFNKSISEECLPEVVSFLESDGKIIDKFSIDFKLANQSVLEVGKVVETGTENHDDGLQINNHGNVRTTIDRFADLANSNDEVKEPLDGSENKSALKTQIVARPSVVSNFRDMGKMQPIADASDPSIAIVLKRKMSELGTDRLTKDQCRLACYDVYGDTKIGDKFWGKVFNGTDHKFMTLSNIINYLDYASIECPPEVKESFEAKSDERQPVDISGDEDLTDVVSALYALMDIVTLPVKQRKSEDNCRELLSKKYMFNDDTIKKAIVLSLTCSKDGMIGNEDVHLAIERAKLRQ